MKYLSIFSGIEAATVAWEPLGFEALAFAQFDPEHNYKKHVDFASEVLKQRFPQVENLGDVTNFKNWSSKYDPDIIIGGSPCQSFSIAGLRNGMDDPRGNLTLTYLGVIEKYRPEWFIWENVPGVLSSNKGGDFASFLRGIQELGYGFAYRVLDAQGFGVPQRRRRVFIVGHITGYRRAVAVLFDSESLRGDIGKNESKRKSATKSSIRLFREGGHGEFVSSESAGTLRVGGGNTSSIVCFEPRSQDGVPRIHQSVSPTLNTMQGGQRQPCIAIKESAIVRRFTPLECERLQGFPDNFTRINWRGKTLENCPDSPRYKVIGNSMAVPVIKWIGERIKLMNDIG